ncbi:LacI family DNA-binding transcriptional regulator [Microbacterium sp. P5_E9]
MRRAANISDVAREAGVSRAAVSKVIRDAYGVSDQMRVRVNDAIERLDYRPRVAARAMRGTTSTIGIELPDIGNPFFDKIIDGAAAAREGTGFQLIIAPAGRDVEEGRRAITALSDRQVDGIIAISPLVATEWLESLAQRVPIVMVGRHDNSLAYDTVTGDDIEGTRLVMDHLHRLGHRKIAHLTRSAEVTAFGSGTPHAVRLEEYERFMSQHGLEGVSRVIRSGPTEDESRGAVAEILTGPDFPTAIFAGNDAMALGALRALATNGPSDASVSVAGYDNITIAGHPAVSLTSVDQSGFAMGEHAVELLLSRLAGRTEALHITTAPRLYPRNSTRPPAGNSSEGV